MSNGLKVGVLIVIAGALGFLGYTQFKRSSNDIESRPAETTTMAAPGDGSNAGGAQNEDGALSKGRPKTVMTIDKEEHDFGTIKQGDQVECSFKITNSGTEPLIVEEAHGSCGCTVPDYPKDPIPVGESRDMKVKFNSTGKKGKQAKTVTITANTEPIQKIVTIRAEVDAPETESKESSKEKSKSGH
ncbi:MAG: DUF1573 domain-containing protein [Flavobacteriales bacterium]